jgi:hypothetical protein
LATLRAHDPINGAVTWNGDIRRLVEARCVACHVDGGRGPMSLATYEAARPWARAIREEVLSRRMPKWHAARGYGQFANDRSLTPFEIALIVAWVDAGAVRGPQPSMESPAIPSTPLPPRDTYRTQRTNCGERTVSASVRLLAVRPELDEGGSAGISVSLPDGTREVIAWIRDFEKDFTDTYWLRSPIDLPRGSKLQVDSIGRCRIDLILETTNS